jgi:hypothetical protein
MPQHRIRPEAIDRIWYRALCAAVDPLFEPHFIDHSFANREGKGTHAAIRAYEHQKSGLATACFEFFEY